jgi:hypothetical protein
MAKKSNLKNSESRSAHEHRQIDRLLTQQCFARRFRLNHKEDYDVLIRLRDDVCDVMNEYLGEASSPLYDETAPRLINYFLSLLDVEWGRTVIDGGDVDRVISDPILERITFFYNFSDCVEPVLKVLAKNLLFVKEVLKKYNYFDYMSLPVILALCDGRDLYSRYAKNALLDPIIDAGREGIGKDPKFRVNFAIRLSIVEYIFCSPSVEILAERAETSRGIGAGMYEALSLKVRINTAPAEIDQGMQYFLSSLMELLVVEHEISQCVPNYKAFKESIFFKTYDLAWLTFQRVDQVKGALLGLWCWDLVHNESMTLDKAVGTILLGPHDENREAIHLEEETVRKHYRIIAKQIRPDALKINNGFRLVDEVVTGRPGVRIGLRE